MASLPLQHRAIILEQTEGKPGKVYYPATLKTVPIATLSPGQVLLQVHAAAFNHRDVWLRKGLYPGLQFDSVLGSDCCGTVVAPTTSPLYGQVVLPYPAVGWESDLRGPDVQGVQFGILGGTKQTQGRGTFAEYVAVEERFCVPLPEHLTAEQGAALPLGGLTAWRAVVSKGQVTQGMNVLVTGAGGGVAMQAIQFAKTRGARVWVTSGSSEKIAAAKNVGAEGGVSYKQDDWPKQLAALLPQDNPALDVVIDSGGGDITQRCSKLMRPGGVFIVYGSTTGAPIPATMGEVLKNLELRTSTMGSLAEFKDAIAFVAQNRLNPVIYKVLEGLDKAEEGFEMMKCGSQVGKIIIKVSDGPRERDEGRQGKL